MAAATEKRRAASKAPPSRSAYAQLSPGPGKPAAEVAAHQRARIHSAMVELVAEAGYGAITVRGLARQAGVSTRSFYQHYADKEACFLHVHDLIVRRVVRRIAAVQAGEPDWRQRLRLTIAAFMDELARDPRAARLILVEACAADEVVVDQARRAERTVEATVADCFDRGGEGVEMPPLLVKGVVAGMVSIGRSRALAGRESELPALAGALTEWALSLHDDAAAEISELDRLCVHGEPAAVPPALPSSSGGEEEGAPQGDRALILAAVAKLVATKGYDNLTMSAVRLVAGVPRRNFVANFAGVEDCFLQAFELRARQALSRAGAAGASGSSWAGGVYRAVAAICAEVAAAPDFAGLVFGKLFAAGVDGIRCREGLMAEVVDDIRESGPDPIAADAPALEASIGAIWGILHHYVVGGRVWEAPRAGGSLAYLLLAPIVGAEEATIAIRDEMPGSPRLGAPASSAVAIR